MGKVNVTTYDPKKVNVIVGGRVITGFASDGVVTLAKSEDSVTPSVGAKGDVTYSENANESGTVSLTLMSTSSSLSYLGCRGCVRRRHGHPFCCHGPCCLAHGAPHRPARQSP